MLDEQRKLIETLIAALERSRSALSGRLRPVSPPKKQTATLMPIWLTAAKEIESTYKAWQKSRKELEEWDKIASQFHEHDKERSLAGKNRRGKGKTGGGKTFAV